MANATVLIPPGTSPHTFEPSPSQLTVREYILAGKLQEDEEIAKYRIEGKHVDEALKKVMPSKKGRDVYSKFAEIA